jgi:hypothetical protein
MENKKYYFACLHYMGHKRRVAICLDPAVIDSYLKAGYIIEILDSLSVIEEPKID